MAADCPSCSDDSNDALIIVNLIQGTLIHPEGLAAIGRDATIVADRLQDMLFTWTWGDEKQVAKKQ
jgi:hypothetical protein